MLNAIVEEIRDSKFRRRVLLGLGCLPHLGGRSLRHAVPFAGKVAEVRLH